MDELELAPACGSTAVPGQEGDQMKVVRFDKAESYEPEKDWKRVSLCNEADISVEHFVKPPVTLLLDTNIPALKYALC